MAHPMRSQDYVTLLDPIQESFGNVIALLMFFVIAFGDLMWALFILDSLSMSAMIDLIGNKTCVNMIF